MLIGAAAGAVALFWPGAAAVAAPSQALASPGTTSAAASQPANPHPSGPRFITKPHAAALPSGVSQVCATPSSPGQMACAALVRSNVTGHVGVVPAATPAGYGPSDLQGAYNLVSASSTGGSGETVAVVDAFNDPNAAADLAVYRSQYGLAACNTTTGAGCVTVVNQSGAATPLPGVDTTGGWEAEESIDLDMVSAICPNCHLLLVEANSADITDLGSAEVYAAAHAAFVSNSWNGAEFTDESAFDADFNHPGVAVSFAGGDAGYGVSYPSSSQFVTSVGGTTLQPDSAVARGWSETAWSGTGSGCSALEAAPAWEQPVPYAPTGCLNRTDNDVSAVADPYTPVAVYDTYPENFSGAAAPGWQALGGTSVATAIVSGVYALAGTPTADSYPASYLYKAPSTDFYDVTSGSNGTCESFRQYLCNGETGYDGPTGLGTPDGAAAFSNAVTTPFVTFVDPGTQDLAQGENVSILTQALLANNTGLILSYSATGLPAGLSMGEDARVAGTVTAPPGTYQVSVTTQLGGNLEFTIVVANMNGAYFASAGPATLGLGGLCLDDTGNSSANGTAIQLWTCNGDGAQKWAFTPDANPGGAGTLNIDGKCADITNRSTTAGAKIQLWSCTGAANQQWYIAGSGALVNPVSGTCLDDPAGSTADGTGVDIADCAVTAAGALVPGQTWTLPASPVTSGVTGKCMDDAGDGSADGTKIQVWNCLGDSAQKWVYEPNGTIQINGRCLDVTNLSLLDNAPIQLWSCTGAPNQEWVLGPNGELINALSAKCLQDPVDNSANGTQLTQGDCYGNAGEAWAVT